jgi:hypothetical protein
MTYPAPAPHPGWYPDPSGGSGQQYFDGQQWTAYAPPPPQPQPQPSIVINNTLGGPAPVVVTTGPNHALHLVLSLLTCGAWLPPRPHTTRPGVPAVGASGLGPVHGGKHSAQQMLRGGSR